VVTATRDSRRIQSHNFALPRLKRKCEQSHKQNIKITTTNLQQQHEHKPLHTSDCTTIELLKKGGKKETTKAYRQRLVFCLGHSIKLLFSTFCILLLLFFTNLCPLLFRHFNSFFRKKISQLRKKGKKKKYIYI
jgi:hypothetical protein